MMNSKINLTIAILILLSFGCKPIKTVAVDDKTKVVHGKDGVTQIYSDEITISKNKEASKYNNEGLALAKKGDFKNAKMNFEKALAIDGEDPWYLTNLALAEMFLKNYNRGINLLKKAIDVDPENYSHYLNLAVIYNKNKNFEKSIETNLIGLKCKTDDKQKGFMYINLAEAYQNNKNCSEAKEALDKGKELFGDKVYEVIFELKDLEKSIEKCKK
jgi:tetratricopeptide (TPR) repeat protein